MSMTIEKAVSFLYAKAGEKERESIDELRALPEVQAILEREDGSVQTKRRELIAKLKAVPAQTKKAQEECARACRAASVRVDAARKEMMAALEDESVERTRLAGLSSAEATEIFELRTELVELSDSRLQTLADHLEDLLQMSRHMGWAEPTFSGKDIEGHPVPSGYVSNWPEVLHARAELTRVKDEVRELQFVAISKADLTEKLQKMLFELEAALHPIELSVLRLDESGGIFRDHSRTRGELVDGVLRKLRPTPTESFDRNPEDRAASGARVVAVLSAGL